ncbi:MAG: site-2 protease family protein [Clostridia bacterium]|nr:site-2 protease family protein [Clostridia bacterium]
MLDYLQTLLSEPIAFFDEAIFRVLAVLIGLCCHEWGHAYAAHCCGDDTAKRAGRLTLNPLAHLDPMGALLMFFVGFGWAKPVPVNPYRYKGNRVRADLFVSLAGITVNIILFVLFTVACAGLSLRMWRPEVVAEYGLTTLVSYRYNAVWSVISGTVTEDFGLLIANAWVAPLVRLCAYTALVNLNLAVFNLIPLPPLDGYHVVNDLIFRGRFRLSQRAFQIGMLIVMVLSAQGILGRIISAVVYPAQDLLLLPIGAVWG